MIQAWLNRIGTAVPAHDIHAQSVDFARTLITDERIAALGDGPAPDIERRYTILATGPCRGTASSTLPLLPPGLPAVLRPNAWTPAMWIMTIMRAVSATSHAPTSSRRCIAPYSPGRRRRPANCAFSLLDFASGPAICCGMFPADARPRQDLLVTSSEVYAQPCGGVRGVSFLRCFG